MNKFEMIYWVVFASYAIKTTLQVIKAIKNPTNKVTAFLHERCAREVNVAIAISVAAPVALAWPAILIAGILYKGFQG